VSHANRALLYVLCRCLMPMFIYTLLCSPQIFMILEIPKWSDFKLLNEFEAIFDHMDLQRLGRIIFIFGVSSYGHINEWGLEVQPVPMFGRCAPLMGKPWPTWWLTVLRGRGTAHATFINHSSPHSTLALRSRFAFLYSLFVEFEDSAMSRSSAFHYGT